MRRIQLIKIIIKKSFWIHILLYFDDLYLITFALVYII
jgi:hypothetical protein